MAFIFCLSMLTIALLGHIDAAPAGSCSLHNFEESFGELFDFQHNRRYPENQNEMNAFCTENLRVLPLAESYDKNCLHDTIKTIVGKLLDGIRMEAKLYCEQPDSKDTLEMIEVGKCLNNNVAKWGKCMDDSAYKFAMIKFAPKDVRVPHVCCQYQGMLTCIYDVMMNNGCKDANSPLKDLIHEYIKSFMSSLCDGFIDDDGGKCSSLPALPQKDIQIKGSFLKSMIEIFESIKD